MTPLSTAACIIALAAGIAIFSCTFGMLVAYRSLEHLKFTEVIDGKEEVHIALRLGPFTYSIVVPERQEKE